MSSRSNAPAVAGLSILFALAAAVAVAACSPRPRTTGEAVATVRHAAPVRAHKPARSRRAVDAPPVEAALAVRSEDGVEFALSVANASAHRVELSFPDGHTRDFAVYDAGGREVWRWSRGRVFTQSMQNRMLASGDQVVYAERWVPPAPGRYTVVAQLRSANFPMVRQQAFVVPASAAGPSQVAAH